MINFFSYLRTIFSIVLVVVSLHSSIAQRQLKVAIHPYMPRGEQFKKVLQKHWDAMHTGVTIKFTDFNFYKEDPAPDVDVFVFDVFFINYFKSKNYIHSIPATKVKDTLDFMDYAWNGCKINGIVYGIPYLGCQYVYFYRADDKELDRDMGLNEFYSIIGPSTTTETRPEEGKGLLVDMSEPVARTFYYFNAVMNASNAQTANPSLPPVNHLDTIAIKNLRTIAQMGSYGQVSDSTLLMQRIKWFTEGYGRAMVGWTELLEFFPDDKIQNYKFRIMPLSNNIPDKNAYPLDVVAISAHIDNSLLTAATRLANLMASREILFESMNGTPETPSPQFLIPVRKSLMRQLVSVHPQYIQIANLLDKHPAFPFQLGEGSRKWISVSRRQLETQILK